MTSLSYPEKVIKYMMLKNHIYIKSKWDCLKHLFVIKNNCCYWNNEGDFILFEPVTDKMVDEVKISTSFIRDPNVLRMMKSHTKEYIDKIEINSKFELMIAVFTSENIDMLCKKTPEGSNGVSPFARMCKVVVFVVRKDNYRCRGRGGNRSERGEGGGGLNNQQL